MRQLQLTLIDVAFQSFDVGWQERQLAVLVQQCRQLEVTTAAAMTWVWADVGEATSAQGKDPALPWASDKMLKLGTTRTGLSPQGIATKEVTVNDMMW